jgi:hypothetical protein
MAGSHVRCQRCTHPHFNHHPECFYTRQGGWDEKRKAFLQIDRCDCKAYVGIDPKDLNECDHEFQPTIDATLCVHCLKRIPAPKR